MKEVAFDIPSSLSFVEHKYQIIALVGEGTFSSVFKAQAKKDDRLVALKVVTKTSAPCRILEELNILKTLDGENNCIALLDVMRHQDQVVMVFPFINPIDFKDFIVKSTIEDVRCYMYYLIKSVAHLHSKGIMHRDIKPGNFLYDMDLEEGYLIDFGLAQQERAVTKSPTANAKPLIFFKSIVTQSKPPGYYEKDNRPLMKAPRAGTRGFRAPEVLFRCVNQTKAIDMWSIGVIMLSIFTGQFPFFLSLDDTEGLVEIAIIFGNANMRKAAKHYGRIWKSNIPTIQEADINILTLINKLNPNLEIDFQALNLLNRLLELISENRITAEEALLHPFFDKLHI